MSRQTAPGFGAVRGTIRSRLLVNALVDPEEAARRLPAGLRPHVTGEGTVVGCCLLDLAAVRPARLPAAVGTSFRAAAHRISVEWDDGEVTTVGVFVPLRLSPSRAAVALGGRAFPGVHRRASVGLTGAGPRVAWSVEPGDALGSYAVRVEASPQDVSPAAACEPVAGTCLGADVGLSPGHDGALEAARMTPRHRQAQPVDVHDLDSAFLAGFASARPAPSYLMRNVDVTWTRYPTTVAHQPASGRNGAAGRPVASVSNR
ncbi:MAG TPA: hypothetical protein VKB57_12220 [Acidimicrobiales bacterium]|nr:hypothetical protein [Acidimicrobiales bacterium]